MARTRTIHARVKNHNPTNKGLYARLKRPPTIIVLYEDGARDANGNILNGCPRPGCDRSFTTPLFLSTHLASHRWRDAEPARILAGPAVAERTSSRLKAAGASSKEVLGESATSGGVGGDDGGGAESGDALEGGTTESGSALEGRASRAPPTGGSQGKKRNSAEGAMQSQPQTRGASVRIADGPATATRGKARAAKGAGPGRQRSSRQSVIKEKAAKRAKSPEYYKCDNGGGASTPKQRFEHYNGRGYTDIPFSEEQWAALQECIGWLEELNSTGETSEETERAFIAWFSTNGGKINSIVGSDSASARQARMMVFFDTKTSPEKGELLGLCTEAVEKLIIEILMDGLGLESENIELVTLELYGGLALMSMPKLKSQGPHRDVAFRFKDYEKLCIAVNVPVRNKRSVILFPWSQTTKDGGITKSSRPVEFFTYPKTMFAWNPKLFHAGGANTTDECSVTLNSISNRVFHIALTF